LNYKKLLENKINLLKKEHRYRIFVELERLPEKNPKALWHTNKKTNEVTVWCSNDYLGMSQNKDVIKKVNQAILKYGVGAGGTRNISGTSTSIVALEKLLSKIHNKEKSIIFTSGYVANETSISTLIKLLNNPVVFSDELNHASIISGIQKNKDYLAKVIFKHNNITDLENKLKQFPLERHKIIIFESVYSMSGSISPIEEIVKLSKKYNCLTYLDEVHAVGMYGEKGGGVAQEMNLENEIDIIQGTLAKAYGAVGGYIASNELICDAIRSYGSGFIFTSALPPALLEGALFSVRHLKFSSMERTNQRKNVKLLKDKLINKSIPFINNNSHIIPIIVGDSKQCSEISYKLLEEYKIYIQPINYPTVPRGTERLRITPGPFHSEEMIDYLALALKNIFEEFQPISYLQYNNKLNAI